MSSFEFNSNGNVIVAHNKTLFQEFPHDLFCLDYLLKNKNFQLHNLDSINVRGRGCVYNFTYNDHDLVIRHYYRGGLISKILNDQYIWQGLSKARSIAEVNLLDKLHNLNLPVPVPAAARIEKNGLFYRADLVTKLIPNSISLSTMLQQNFISNKIWYSIGMVIRELHDNYCNHSDLNTHNILLDKGNKIYLVDFDKSTLEKKRGDWCKQNLTRLHRSLIKLKGLEKEFHFSENDFKVLLSGYKGD